MANFLLGNSHNSTLSFETPTVSGLTYRLTTKTIHSNSLSNYTNLLTMSSGFSKYPRYKNRKHFICFFHFSKMLAQISYVRYETSFQGFHILRSIFRIILIRELLILLRIFFNIMVL